MSDPIPEKKTLLILGPTAIGKSDYAIQKAQELDGEIISADAFQVYKGMDIGTAKVSLDCRKKTPHHLIDIKNPDDPYNVSEFVDRCNAHIDDILKRGKTPIICGGTGFYIHALLYNYTFIKESDEQKKIRASLSEKEKQIGLETLWTDLFKIDPKTANNISKQDRKRIFRGLEVYALTKKPPSFFRHKDEKPREDIALIALSSDRDIIYDRINNRVDAMIEQGLIDEVKSLHEKYGAECLAFHALGYKETIAYLNGTIDKELMRETIKTKTRQFAKRQLTWFRRYEHAKWINIT